MPFLALDLGGTKLASAVFSNAGELLLEEKMALEGRQGSEAAKLIAAKVATCLQQQSQTGQPLTAIGIAVPGIYRRETGTVWAPNIPGWTDYPLLSEIKAVTGNIPVSIDSDRACYILGESWQGAARGCTDAIYLAVGTGIGAGIMVNGTILRGASDIAGAIGWLALQKPFNTSFKQTGCFESMASGEGMARLATQYLQAMPGYEGILKSKPPAVITAHHVFEAYKLNDPVAGRVMGDCIELWGMAVANLVSLFNPQKIIMGGGVFGPAIQFIPAIIKEAEQWAQPVSMQQVTIEASALGNKAGLYGAAALAMECVMYNG